MAHDHSHDHGDATVVALGTISLGGARFAVDREGECEAGASCTFGVELLDGALAPTRAWVVDVTGFPASDAVEGEGHDEHWHFAITPQAGATPTAFVLGIGDASGVCCGLLGGDESAPLALKAGAAPQHGGILAAGLTRDGEDVGFCELKLHDDLGDLELWLSALGHAHLPHGIKPLDVAADAKITLTFPSHEGKTATLSVRNAKKNEDEDGNPNMRNGKTNYFIFPGETGQDPEWLKGLKWRGVVEVAFETGGAAYACAPFVLVPHSVL